MYSPSVALGVLIIMIFCIDNPLLIAAIAVVAVIGDVKLNERLRS